MCGEEAKTAAPCHVWDTSVGLDKEQTSREQTTDISGIVVLGQWGGLTSLLKEQPSSCMYWSCESKTASWALQTL